MRQSEPKFRDSLLKHQLSHGTPSFQFLNVRRWALLHSTGQVLWSTEWVNEWMDGWPQGCWRTFEHNRGVRGVVDGGHLEWWMKRNDFLANVTITLSPIASHQSIPQSSPILTAAKWGYSALTRTYTARNSRGQRTTTLGALLLALLLEKCSGHVLIPSPCGWPICVNWWFHECAALVVASSEL